jgi:hypothetical protein
MKTGKIFKEVKKELKELGKIGTPCTIMDWTAEIVACLGRSQDEAFTSNYNGARNNMLKVAALAIARLKEMPIYKKDYLDEPKDVVISAGPIKKIID